jgi:Ca2+-binding EF-hand superfamily protein
MGLQLTKNTLNETDLDMLHTQSKMPKAEIILWHEHFIKQCPNGKMDKKTFLEYYQKFKKDVNVEEIVDRCFEAFDADKNGYVEFNEVTHLKPILKLNNHKSLSQLLIIYKKLKFLIAYIITSDQREESSQRNKLNYVFELYDLDHNKLLDESEIRYAIRLMFKILGVKEENVNFERCIQDIMCSLDSNNDKQVNYF